MSGEAGGQPDDHCKGCRVTLHDGNCCCSGAITTKGRVDGVCGNCCSHPGMLWRCDACGVTVSDETKRALGMVDTASRKSRPRGCGGSFEMLEVRR